MKAFFISPIGKWQRICLVGAVAFGMTALCACGGGSSGGKSNNAAPTAAITSPLDGGIHTYEGTITFTGFGTDDEDGELGGESLVWASDLSGSINPYGQQR